MKPIEKPQFFALCEIMSNTNTYYQALRSLQCSSVDLANCIETIQKLHSLDYIRWCPDLLLDEMASVEMNLELIKQRYIHDIMEEFEAHQEKILSQLCKKYHITED